MSTLLSQLGVGVNPLSTAVGQRIEQATDSSLSSEDWALNMEICDIINETDEGPKDALRAIRKRLQQNAGKNYTVVMHTLVVLETCVKNCGTRFQLLATQKDFVQDLVKLIGPKNDPPSAVQEKVLIMIQSWANAFRSSVEMQGVVSMYNELKQKGITFPSPVEAPVLTPSRAVSSSEPVQQFLSKAVSKLEQELRVVRGNMDVFNEMLNELVPGQEHLNDRELLQDLYRTCQNMQSRIVELIDRVGNEKITEDLLSVNDELNQLFMRYEQFEKQRTLLPTEQDFQNALQNKPLIDLDETDTQQQFQGLNLDSSEVDEFSALAQSRSAGDAPLPVQSAITEFAREQDIEEVARWLDNKPEDLEGHSDFERFLASRAAAAEQLPTLPSDKKS